jgi:sn-glycerol 3-phosphate transport system substrate-binding protein
MKKLVSLVLALMMVMAMAGTALAYSPEEPITILFWHTRGSGANLEATEQAVADFNDTIGKEKGIIVEPVYIGGYDVCYTKVQLASQSGEQPVITTAGNTYIAPLIEDGIIYDMMPLAERDGFDVNNILDCFMEIAGNTDGQLYSLPYVRSTPVLYYNKTLADELGLTAPTTIDELVEFAKAFIQKDADGTITRWGFEMFNDYGYYQASFLWQLGESMVAADGTSPALEGSSLLKQLSDWKAWVDEGICRPFDSTNAGSTVKEMLYQGKIGCYLDSSGSMKNNIKYMEEAGYELGVAEFPTYDINNRKVEVGGGQIALVGMGNTEEQIEAGWEFMKFIMSDEQVYLNSTRSGYLPVTKSIATYEPMVKFWEENPSYKVSFDQMLDYGVCQEYPFFADLQEYIVNIQEVVSLLIQEGSITAEEAVQQIKDNSAHLF